MTGDVPSRGRISVGDGPWLALTILPFVALIVPSRVLLTDVLGSNGWPARLLVFWIALAFVLGWVGQRALPRETSPAERGLFVLLGGLVISAAATFLRPPSSAEVDGMVREALVLFPLAVVALGIAATADRRRTDLLLIGIVAGTAVSVLFAGLEVFRSFNVFDLYALPGIVVGDPWGGENLRGGFVRARGATVHPIELGVLSGAAIPLAYHYVRFAPKIVGRVAALGAVALALVGAALSVSRSGVLAAAVAVAVYFVVMGWGQRIVGVLLAVGGFLAVRQAIPGLADVVIGLFDNLETDASILGRTEDYVVVRDLFTGFPLFGRGLGTFRPEVYFYLDNQYLMVLLNGGLVLLVAVLAWVVLTLAATWGAVRRAQGAADASRAQAVAAAFAAILVCGITFDLFSFGQATVVTFLLAGVAGALWHESREHGVPFTSPGARFSRGLRGSASSELQPAESS